ncbi:MAG TPA: hypothetical protein PL124_05100 [Candidatus Cloacimonadota bacterium]|nr:hypothetical protein [Candidatus Cloacimonadota bacterium]HPS38773.1 hypothetical protein [Candidatus Cloacimonadota bacterium]
MADTVSKPNPETVKVKPEPTKKKAKPAPESANRIGLIELMMILMLVGLVFVFVFPMKQMKVDKAQELVSQGKVEALIPTFEKIVVALDKFVNDPKNEFKDYPFDLSQLNLGTVDTPEFKFSWDEMNKNIKATSTKEYGKEGIIISFNINDKVYTIDDKKPDVKPVVKDEWLPEE